jgi:two-component system cell cycle sensor histidine kinase/response regulator CckA
MTLKRGTETILVVDDDVVIRDITAVALRTHGYTVMVARSGAEALALLKDHDGVVHLLLTDISMPGLSGGEVAEAVAAMQPAIKVLFMSGYSAGAALHDNVRDEGVAFLAKPFVPNILLRKVRSVLDGV